MAYIKRISFHGCLRFGMRNFFTHARHNEQFTACADRYVRTKMQHFFMHTRQTDCILLSIQYAFSVALNRSAISTSQIRELSLKYVNFLLRLRTYAVGIFLYFTYIDVCSLSIVYTWTDLSWVAAISLLSLTHIHMYMYHYTNAASIERYPNFLCTYLSWLSAETSFVCRQSL